MYLEVCPKVGAGHVLGAANVTDEPFVPKVHGAHVTCHVLVGLEGCIAVLAGVASLVAVSAAVILVEAALVEGLVTLVTTIATLVGVQYHVVLIRLQAFEALVAYLALMFPLARVHLHVPLEVVQSGALIVTLVTLVAARRPVLQDAVDVQTPLFAKGLATGWTLVLRVPCGRSCMELLLVHASLEQTAEPLVTFWALVLSAVRTVGPDITM